MTQSPRVVFFGNERLVSGLKRTDAPLLRGLIDRGYIICAVVVNHHETVSRNTRPLEVAEIASQHNIPVLSPAKLSDIADTLRDFKADCAVLAAYGRIIPQLIIDIFAPVGIINVHPSLLPRHRGSTPIETTILAGDSQAGVSVMQLTAGMDEGPIYDQRAVKLSGNENKFELYEQLSHLGAEMVFELLPEILSGQLKPIPQRTDDVSYTTTISKQDGILDPLTDTAEIISRKVRAYLNFPKSKLRYRDNDVIVTSATTVTSCSDGRLCIPCNENSTLLVESLIAPNGKSMSGDAYLRGLR